MISVEHLASLYLQDQHDAAQTRKLARRIRDLVFDALEELPERGE